MGYTGVCWDAMAESFFATLKTEESGTERFARTHYQARRAGSGDRYPSQDAFQPRCR